jgi:hypothetical protein
MCIASPKLRRVHGGSWNPLQDRLSRVKEEYRVISVL